mgnify:CR=1 FL=1
MDNPDLGSTLNLTTEWNLIQSREIVNREMINFMQDFGGNMCQNHVVNTDIENIFKFFQFYNQILALRNALIYIGTDFGPRELFYFSRLKCNPIRIKWLWIKSLFLMV